MVTRAFFLLEVQLLAETDRWVDGAHRLHMHLSTSLHFCVTVILSDTRCACAHAQLLSYAAPETDLPASSATSFLRDLEAKLPRRPHGFSFRVPF